MKLTLELILVDKVIDKLALKSPERVTASDVTRVSGYINEAYNCVSPFKPSALSADRLNSYLLRHKANEMQCISAWTMFMELHSRRGLHVVPKSSQSAA